MSISTSRSVLALGLLVAGCTRVTIVDNPDHCARNEGDRYCAELFPERPYCNLGEDECSIGDRYGCVAEVSPECHEPCGVLGDECLAASGSGTDTGTSTATESGSETASESGSESGSSTTGPAPCLGNEDCPDVGAPFCDMASGECVPCDQTDDPDGSCAALDPATPLCVAGACVQCTPENPAACTDMTPVCDGATNACVPCTAHDQCGEAACNLFTGACLPAGAVVHVGPGQAFATLAAAVASFAAETEGTIVVHAGPPNYDETVTVSAGRVLAFLAADIGVGIEPPRWVRTSGGMPQLIVSADTTVLLDGLQLSSNASAANPALRITGGQAWVDRSRIVQNSGSGVLAEVAAELVLRNSFVGLNGGGFVDTRGLTVTGSSLDIRYTTIAANDGTGASGPVSIYCDALTAGEVRSSIIAAGTDTIDCTNATFDFNVVDTGGLAGANNDVLVFDAFGWFPNLAMADFHISAGPPFVDVAQWQAGDPATDIDGDPRPDVDGSPDYVGADVP